MQLITREQAMLAVCRRWRYALLSDFAQAVISDCHVNSTFGKLPFFSKHTRDVWLRFDGALLFGNWAIEWARIALEHSFGNFSIRKLIMVIVEAPNIMTTEIEAERAKELVDVCQKALRPQRLGLFSQPCAAEISGVQSRGIGDKFACIYMHFSRMPAPPILTSIDTSRISHESMLWLIASNANTLEYLRIGRVLPSDLQLLVDRTTSNLVFENLRELQITLDVEDARLESYQISKSHFPRLEVLFADIPNYSLLSRYQTRLSVFEHAFLTDLFFAWKHRLRMVRFPIAWDTVDLLTPTTLPEARELYFYQICMEGEHALDNAESNQLLSNLLSLKNIQTISTNTLSYFAELPDNLYCTELTTLEIPRFYLTASQIRFFLCKIPSLKVLHCRLGEDPIVTAKAGICWQTDTRNQVAFENKATANSLQTLQVSIPSETSDVSVECFFSMVAALPCIRTIYLPSRLSTSLYRHLLQASQTSRYRWSSAMLDNINIRALASSDTK
ncbi:hypothetical protein LPJ68_005590 [Coemansia sp. RSA 1086]|nr:hypothetical protein LPJ68_005590 [Coemansia sp. RSA 1086]